MTEQDRSSQREKCRTFRMLHEEPDTFLLLNCWDAVLRRMILGCHIVLRKLGIVDASDAVVSADFVTKGKPDPAIY